jgi:phosphoribosyl-AMP cyclohydrolase
LKVETASSGAACHTGRKSCFYRAVPVGPAPGGGLTLRFVDAARQFDPEIVYRHSGAAKRTLKSSE